MNHQLRQGECHPILHETQLKFFCNRKPSVPADTVLIE